MVRPSLSKINNESLSFLQRIQGDIFGPIHPPCVPFRYFMILIDASVWWSHACLLSTCNVTCVVQILMYLQAHESIVV